MVVRIRNSASSTRPASLPASATRVNARTCENDNRPAPNAPAITGNAGSERATRTRSRAAFGLIPVFQLNQCAHDSNPGPAHAWRASNSPISSNYSASPAANRHASVVIAAAI